MQSFFQPGASLEAPTLVLQDKSGASFGAICGASEITYKRNLNSANELSFTVAKYWNGTLNPLWNCLTDLKNIYVPEFKERFEIKISCHEESMETKSVTALSLCEAELGQIMLRGLEINTDFDLEHNSSDAFPVTVFYMDIDETDSPSEKEQKKKHSLLHRVLSDKAFFYTIGEVDSSLKDLAYTFSADGTSIYDFLTGEVAQQMQCLFQFDSMTRKINVYALSDDSYGSDTSILIDRENLASSLTCEGDCDSLKNCFYVEGGDDVINAAFAQINPSGGQYIYYFSPEMLAEMPEHLQGAISQYDAMSKNYLENHPLNPEQTTHRYRKLSEESSPCMVPDAFDPDAPDANYVLSFQNIVNQITSLTDEAGQKPYKDYGYTVPQTFRSHADLVAAFYHAMDFHSFLEVKMMPDYKMEVYDKYHALSRLNASNFGTVGIAGLNFSNPQKTSINTAIANKAKTLVNTGLYGVSIASSQITATKNRQGNQVLTWTGTFAITDRQNEDATVNTVTNATFRSIAEKEAYNLGALVIPDKVTLTVNDDIISCAKNSIASMLSKKDLSMAVSLYSADVSLQNFQQKLKFYGLASLNTIQSTLTDCIGILEDQLEKIKNTRQENTPMHQELIESLSLYTSKQDAVLQLVSTRESQLHVTECFLLLAQAYLTEVHDVLDFKKYLASYGETLNPKQNLWEIFQYYRREGEYRNDNIISTGLDNNEAVISRAQKLMELASKELETAGTMQYSISTTMSNLLALPEFDPVKLHFDVGNWIRVRMDMQDETGREIIYKLRLLSCQINYGENNASDMQVEFSTVTQNASGVLSDVESILNSAQTIAKSYNSTVRQAELSSKAAKTVEHWVLDGLDLTKQQILSSAKDQSLVIDSSGLLARKQDPLTETYDDCQLRIFHNGIYTTSDNWKTMDAALGKFWYQDPMNNWQPTENYGVIARKLVGRQILGEDLQIFNRSGSMEFTDQGLSISNGVNTILFQPDAQDSAGRPGRLFQITSNTADSRKTSVSRDLLYTDSEGNLNITGNIAATSGTIGGFDINETYLSKGTDSLGDQENSVYIGTDGISCSESFKVTKDGVMTASNVIIHASSGENAVTIDANGIQSNRYMCGNNSQEELCFYGFCAGSRNYCNLLRISGNTSDGTSYTAYLNSDCDNFFFRRPVYANDIHTQSLSASGGIKLKYGRYSSAGTISCPWKDENYHDVINAAEDGLSLYIGWAGSFDYATNTILRGSSVRLKNASGTVVTSDERLKHSFKTMETYESFFDSLEPFFFKLNDGNSQRYHSGFKAQQVLKALQENNLTSQDFAGYVKYAVDADSAEYRGYDEEYGLIYSEFTALNTHMIQKTRRELQEAKRTIASLQQEIAELKQAIKNLQEVN